jgi:hypothetical protein
VQQQQKAAAEPAAWPALHYSGRSFVRALGVRQVLCGLLMGDLRGMSEMVSEGKSGSLFYWTHDAKFMVKTVSADEREAMRGMLRAYRNHVLLFPSTLLARYLGFARFAHGLHTPCARLAHALHMPSLRLRARRVNSLYDLRVAKPGGGHKLYHLVIMSNVFNTPLSIDERFDLKGSTKGRTVSPALRGTVGLVHKDEDFVAMERRIRLPPHLARTLRHQVEIDTNFLKTQGVIDYSLLLGVHHVQPSGPPAPQLLASAAELAEARGRRRAQRTRRRSGGRVAGAGAFADYAEPPAVDPPGFAGWVSANAEALRKQFEQLTGRQAVDGSGQASCACICS